MNKQLWQRAYHLGRFAFKNEKAAYISANDEGLVEEMHVARDCWVRGNTNWEDTDFISRCQRVYRQTLYDNINNEEGLYE